MAKFLILSAACMGEFLYPCESALPDSLLIALFP